MNALPPVTAPRTEYLRNYLLACLRDNILSASDMLSVSLLTRMQTTLSRDVRSVLAELGTHAVTTAACGLLNKLRP